MSVRVVCGALALLAAAPLLAGAAPKKGGAARVPVVVKVIDADAKAPVAARVYAQRVEAGADKARGSDAFDEPLTLKLTPGRYRLTATRGPEYTVDQREITVEAGGAAVELSLRRVVSVGEWRSCDLHVHSSHGFDSRMSPEDRVRSLVAAGLSFAAPTEHNTVGSYESTSAGRRGLRWAPAMEVTSGSAGHFTVFPYAGETAPATRRVAAGSLLAALRRDNPEALIQINHPRLNGDMGFFNLIRLNTRKASSQPDPVPPQADAIEVLNGIEMNRPGQIDRVFGEWLALFEAGQGRWATGGSDVHHDHQPPPGYPRTYALPDASAPSQDKALVRALRSGSAFVTTGPFVELSQGERGPGAEAQVEAGKTRVRVRVQAPPWMDVRRIELWAGGRIAWQRELAERPAVVGPPGKDADQEREAAVRFDEEVSVPIAAGARALVLVARGERALSGVIPGARFVPFGFTNPMRLSDARPAEPAPLLASPAGSAPPAAAAKAAPPAAAAAKASPPAGTRRRQVAAASRATPPR